jgi:hypothetical protein
LHINTPINSSDSLNTAIGKAQWQINALKTNLVDYTEVFKDNTLLGITASAFIQSFRLGSSTIPTGKVVTIYGCIGELINKG